jgi:hypothetical protein
VSLLDQVAHFGPLRRLAVLTWTGTCPNCRQTHALTIQITPCGELPSCRHGCLPCDVHRAVKASPTNFDAGVLLAGVEESRRPAAVDLSGGGQPAPPTEDAA